MALTVITLAAGPALAQEAAVPASTGTVVETATLPHDLSPWGMISHADPLVQVVMAGLAFASVVTWTIALVKLLELVAAAGYARSGMAALRRARSLEDAGQALQSARGTCAELVRGALAEVAASVGTTDKAGIKERAAWQLERQVVGSARSINAGTGLIATIGATSPFVGLFGTVWGIMNAFIGISQAQTTNLAVVAPGIAEALLATAIGLVAAIPAVVIYNLFARGLAAHKARMADAVSETMRLLSRDLDRVPAGRLRAVGD